MPKIASTPLTAQELIRRNLSLEANRRFLKLNSLSQQAHNPGLDVFGQEALPDPSSFKNFVAAKNPTPKVSWGNRVLNRLNFPARLFDRVKQVASTKIGRYSSVGKATTKVKRAASFTNWKYSRAISKIPGRLVTRFPQLTLPARMLGFVATKVPFLGKLSAARILLPQLLKPLARFVPYIGTALLVADIGIPLIKWGYGLFNKPKIVKPKITSTEPLPPTAGRASVLYIVSVRSCSIASPNICYDRYLNQGVYGPIEGLFFDRGEAGGFIRSRHYVLARDAAGLPKKYEFLIEGQISDTTATERTFFTDIHRADGQPDVGDTVSPFNPLITTARNVRTMMPGESPYSDYLPGGSKYRPLTADPTPARQPAEENKRQPLTVALPAGKSVTLTAPDGNAVTVSPAPVPRIITIPRPLPRQLPGGLEPDYDRSALPITITSPNAAPIVLSSPGAEPLTIAIPGQEPFTFNPLNPSTTPLPINPLAPDAPRVLAPSTTPTPIPTTPLTTADLAPLIASIPSVLANSSAFTGGNRITTKEAICEESQPEGCIGSPLQGLGDLLGNIGGQIASNLPTLQNSTDENTQTLDNILARLEALEARENEALDVDLSEVIAKLDKLSAIVGVDDYPASLPASFISTEEPAAANVSVPSLTRFFSWYVERFDEVVGQFEIPIEIKDSDPTTPGDQPTKFKLPNLAESIAEIVTLLFTINMNTDLLVSMGFRTMLEAGQDKQQNFISYKLLHTLTDFLGYKYKEVEVEIPMMFNPAKTRFDEILAETTVKVAVAEYDEKMNFQVDLMNIRKIRSILDSVYFRKIKTGGDIQGQLMQTLKDLLLGMKAINKDDDEDMSEFIQEVESGFVRATNNSNPFEPYGRDASQRPKVTDLSNYQPPTE